MWDCLRKSAMYDYSMGGNFEGKTEKKIKALASPPSLHSPFPVLFGVTGILHFDDDNLKEDGTNVVSLRIPFLLKCSVAPSLTYF